MYELILETSSHWCGISCVDEKINFQKERKLKIYMDRIQNITVNWKFLYTCTDFQTTLTLRKKYQ